MPGRPSTPGPPGPPGLADDGEPDGDVLEQAMLAEIEDLADTRQQARAHLGALRGSDYLSALVAAVPAMEPAAQALGRLLEAVQADPRWHVLALREPSPRPTPGESLELRLGADPALQDSPGHEVAELVRGLGGVVDLLVRRDPGPPPRASVFAELSGGLRLRILATPAGAVPTDGVLLHGAGPPAREGDTPVPGAGPVTGLAVGLPRARAWLFEGWWALGDVAAALGASSFLQAGESLAEVRRAVCRLWAVGEGVPDPGTGLAALLRVPEARTPKGLEQLMPRALPAELRTAALAAADQLHAAANHAGRRLGRVPRSALEQSVRGRLSARR